MKWPWTKRHEADRQALDEALSDLQEVRDRWPVVHEAAASMRFHRDRNHFAETIASVYRGRP